MPPYVEAGALSVEARTLSLEVPALSLEDRGLREFLAARWEVDLTKTSTRPR